MCAGYTVRFVDADNFSRTHAIVRPMNQGRCFAGMALSIVRRVAGVLWSGLAVSSHSDRWTHDVIVNVGEAGLGELIVQPVVPAAVAGHGDFQSVESFPYFPEPTL